MDDARIPGAETLTEVLEQERPRLMAIPGVLGTGETLSDDGKPAIRIYVDKLTDELKEKIPETIGGYPVVIREVGQIKKL